MENYIRLKSGMEENNFLTRLKNVSNSNTCAYLLHTSYTPVHFARMSDGRFFVKPRGSRAIIEEELLEEAKVIVKNIVYSMSGWVIIFDNKKKVKEMDL